MSLVWDARNLKNHVAVAEDLPTLNSETNAIFSPDERLILTGTGVKKNEGYGKIVMMNSETLEVVRTMSVSQSSVVKVLWHDKLNQVSPTLASALHRSDMSILHKPWLTEQSNDYLLNVRLLLATEMDQLAYSMTRRYQARVRNYVHQRRPRNEQWMTTKSTAPSLHPMHCPCSRKRTLKVTNGNRRRCAVIQQLPIALNCL